MQKLSIISYHIIMQSYRIIIVISFVQSLRFVSLTEPL